MWQHIQQFLWYVFLIALALVVIYVGRSYSIAIVDEGFRFMEPTLEPRSTHILVRTDEAVRTPEVDDIIAFRIKRGSREERWFARVAAIPGMTIATQGDELLVDRRTIGARPSRMADLEHGLIVPRDTVFIVLDAKKEPRQFTLAKRLVPTRNILGRLRNP
jgi:hypothetical protein